MQGQDLKSEIIGDVSLAPAARTTNTDCAGTAINLATGQVLSMAVLNVGTVSGTGGPNLNLKLQSNTTSATTGFTDITGATFTQVTTSNAREAISFRVPAGHNWVRVTGTIGGTTSPSFTCGVDVFSPKKYAQLSGKEGGYDRSPST
jgi:hypothetical protein